MVSVTFPIEIGDLKLTPELQVWTERDFSVVDVDIADLGDITYRGVPIEGYKNWDKFKEFHLDMGIDWQKLIDDEISKHVDPEKLTVILKKKVGNI